ncbi:hypothetical protein MUS1_01425 [Marinomonas ushuaiensis DSM 15871]|uniref:Uncharacterized protein n=1 Tax=Marinomonas ushuaiensis DSM 15871 TaxID=1122207 RepID=X7E9X5_9GAMM|nr:hypothetical protein MUS1_01425 [Marinomonas ushuaiensis DSM 15871]
MGVRKIYGDKTRLNLDLISHSFESEISFVKEFLNSEKSMNPMCIRRDSVVFEYSIAKYVVSKTK